MNLLFGRLSEVLDHKRVLCVLSGLRSKNSFLIPADEQVLLLEVFLDDFLHLDRDLFLELQEAERNFVLHNFVDLFLKGPSRVPSHERFFPDSTTD